MLENKVYYRVMCPDWGNTEFDNYLALSFDSLHDAIEHLELSGYFIVSLLDEKPDEAFTQIVIGGFKGDLRFPPSVFNIIGTKFRFGTKDYELRFYNKETAERVSKAWKDNISKY